LSHQGRGAHDKFRLNKQKFRLIEQKQRLKFTETVFFTAVLTAKTRYFAHQIW